MIENPRINNQYKSSNITADFPAQGEPNGRRTPQLGHFSGSPKTCLLQERQAFVSSDIATQ